MIIVGLGNPGSKYAQTRHNLGWIIVDRLVSTSQGTPWKIDRQVAWSTIGKHWIIKPQSHMNASGPALKDFLSYKKLPVTPAELGPQLIVVHDEIDFPVADMKIQTGRSSAGHNGVQSIIDTWNGWQEFTRLRFGIGNNREFGLPAEDYVLQPLTPGDWELIEPKLAEAVAALQQKLE